MVLEVLIWIGFIVGTILCVPFVAYLWGRAQAAGWIEAFKQSKILTHKKDNGKTKEE